MDAKSSLPQSKESIDPSSALRIERLLGKRIRAARRVTTGFSATQRWLIRADPATRYFAKLGTTPPSIDALRHEAWVYERLRLPCMPAVVAWQDHATTPILILEDLSGLEWPPPWSDRTITMALETIEQIHSSTGPLLSYEERHGTEWDWWRAVEREPEATPSRTAAGRTGDCCVGRRVLCVARKQAVHPYGSRCARHAKATSADRTSLGDERTGPFDRNVVPSYA